MKIYILFPVVCALSFLSCQSSRTDHAPSTADPETEAILSESEVEASPTPIGDSASLARERKDLARERALATPRKLTEYIPILRDTLIGRGVTPAMARRIARPLVGILKPDEYDFVDVMFEDRQDLNRDRQNDLLFTLRYGPYDGNGRGLLVLAMISTGTEQYVAYTTNAIWDRELLSDLPNLDAVRVSRQDGRPYFITTTTIKFPFTKLRL